MTIQQILKTADDLSKELIDKKVNKDYFEQIFHYAWDKRKIKSEKQFSNDLGKLVSKMTNSGFEKRSKSTEEQYKNAAETLRNFKIQSGQSLLDVSQEDFIKILGNTVRLMKYYESEKGKKP